MSDRPDRIDLAPGLNISRLVCGLWQVADLEKDGTTLDPVEAAGKLRAYADAGFDTFDMADHYGSAEIITGELTASAPSNSPIRAFTKWCPNPGPMTAEVVRKGVEDRLKRLRTDSVDLLQFHWWSFEDPRWLDALHELNKLREEGLIKALGVTNFDAAHLHLAIADGIPLVSNQISFSLVDHRATGALSAACARHNVKLLAYGTLCGGFLSERWLGKPEPTDISDWSRAKYKRFIDTVGGWEVFQTLLTAAHNVAQRHNVSLSNVASRWVLEHPAVAATIIGARITENEHRADNLHVFDFALTEEDKAELETAFAHMSVIPGDCGDEYRRPPFLTASGDLSHHLNSIAPVNPAPVVEGRKDQSRVSTGSYWEDVAGYCRAQRKGDRILVSGTTATAGEARIVAKADAAAQVTFILDKISSAISALGGKLEDIVRTRIYLVDMDDCEAVSRAHGRYFSEIRPANTLIGVASLAGEYRVEIEAEAIVDA